MPPDAEKNREYQKRHYRKRKATMNSVQEKEYKNKMVKYQTKYVQRNREKVADRKRKYVRENQEKVKKYRQEYYLKNKVRYEEYRLRRRFNISLEELDVLLIKQQHKCAICKRLLVETKRCIDHNHTTGEVRGILCRNCNAGIGLLGESLESLERAMQYLNDGLK